MAFNIIMYDHAVFLELSEIHPALTVFGMLLPDTNDPVETLAGASPSLAVMR